jgi:hypothetical protein
VPAEARIGPDRLKGLRATDLVEHPNLACHVQQAEDLHRTAKLLPQMVERAADRDRASDRECVKNCLAHLVQQRPTLLADVLEAERCRGVSGHVIQWRRRVSDFGS